MINIYQSAVWRQGGGMMPWEPFLERVVQPMSKSEQRKKERCMWTQLSGEYIINFISLLIISISEAKSHKWWLFKMFAEEATMRVEHFLSEYPSPAFINVFSPHRKLTRCLVESFGERRVSSYIHGGNYLKVSKLSTYMRTPNFFKKSHVWDWPKISSCQAEIVRKKGKSLLNDPLFNKVPSHL